MIRKYAPTILALAALQSPLALALGLGDISLNSSLDQPLSAEIRLRGVGDLDRSQIVVRLASPADFERAGVDRAYFLNEMHFDVDLSQRGEGVIRLSTERPIKEPYIDFVIEVRWPNGRVLREYTALLDLPIYGPAPAPAVRAPVASERDERPTGRSATAPAPRSRRAAGTSADSYEVARGDTLWSIASRVRPEGTSVQRMMLALHDANPKAFIRGNINLLRSGAVLRIPEGGDIDGLSSEQVLATVSEHNRDWRQGSTSGPAEGAAVEGAEQGGVKTADDSAFLRLAGDEAGVTAAGAEAQTGGSNAEALRDQLAVANEALSATELSNAELQDRVKALEQQVANFQKLVELNNDGLAAQQQTAASQADAATPEVPQASPRQAEQSWMERVLGNVWIVGGLATSVLAAMVVFLSRRRRTVEEYSSVAPQRAPVMRAPAAVAVSAPAPVAAVEQQDFDEPASSAVAVESAERAAALAPAMDEASLGHETGSESEASDPIAEADIYIAYGRHERAVSLLREALAGDPTNHELRIKLLEIYGDLNDRDGFLGEFEALERHGDEAAMGAARNLVAGTEREYWLKVGKTPAPAVAEESHDEAVVATLDIEGDTMGMDAEFALDLEEEESEPAEDDEAEFALGSLDLGEIEPAAEIGELELDLPEPELGALDSDASASEDLPLAGEPQQGIEESDLDMLADADEVETKLELARAYVDMGDIDGARDILEEVLADGAAHQREQASALLEEITAG